MISVSAKGRIIIAVLALVVATGGGFAAFKFYDYTQNNPKFCISCHLMKPAYEAWTASEHKTLNCHECHHLTIPEQNKLLITFVLKQPTRVPERHGKVIVPWRFCVTCHWEKDERFPDAPAINNSTMHAKHYFMERIECARCHGYITHQFIPEEKFCMGCHEGKEVHGTGMQALACLNCHTDRTRDLKPERKKCLYCHGGESVRKELIEGGTVDVRRYPPSEETVRKAVKISVTEGSPMQFYCYECHKPHKKVRPDWNDCMRCHKNVPNTGGHKMHVRDMGMKCRECHKPHLWRVTKESAKRDCTKCHEYREPALFL